MLAALLLLAAALADTCEPLDEAEFRSLVLDAQSAIDRDDAATHAAIVAEVQGRIPCLGFAPAPRMWADFLIGVAIVEFARGGEWEKPMGAALRIRPTVDRGVGSGHPIARWEAPPASEASGGPVPEGVSLYVDGVLVDELPPASGLYLVQKTEQGFWATLLLDDAPVPSDWLTEPIEVPTEITAWGLGSFFLGAGGAWQTRSWASDYVADGGKGGTMPGAALRGVLLYGNVGVYGQGSFAWIELGQMSAPSTHIALVMRKGSILWGLGAGTAGAQVYEGSAALADATARTMPLPYVLGTALTRWGEDDRWDGGLTYGVGRAHNRLDVHLGHLGRGDDLKLYLGGAFSVQTARFGQKGDAFADRVVRTADARMGFEIGLQLGSRE